MMGVKTSDVNLFEDITIQMRDTYEKKNADYGNSFEMQYNEYGLISSCIRIEDKLRRLKSLSKQEAKVKEESIEDTLLDLANYSILTIMSIRKSCKE